MRNESSRRFANRWRVIGALVLLPLALLALLAQILISQQPAAASSHREAPLISKDPFADNTDTYVFIPAGSADRIVLAASWIPFEGPEGGPNYWEWDDQALYDIYVDIDGDATADVTYTLQSQTSIGSPLETFLYNTGPLDSVDSPNWNRPQTYSLTESFREGIQPSGDAMTTLVSDVRAAPVNIGSKSTADYASLVSEATYSVMADNGDMIDIYAGQTDDPFFVDLQVFDLLTLRGQMAPIGYSEGNNDAVDSLSGFNVHSLVIELPIARLVRDAQPVLGVWSGTRRNSMGVFAGTGEPVQVSRLGMPLVNEVVLPMGLKDTFNAIQPEVDLTIYDVLQRYVEDPEVGTLLCALYGVPLPADSDADCHTEFDPVMPGDLGNARSGRGDIFDIFLTGMVLASDFTINTADGPLTLPAGFNVNQPAGVVPAEMIRINTAISGDLCAPEPSRLGVLGGDACGYPNGRRFSDDTVEISLLAVAGAAYQVLDGRDASFTFDSNLIGVLTDGVDANDVSFGDTFPYIGMAQSGQEHLHQNPLGPVTGVVLSGIGSLTGYPVWEIIAGVLLLGLAFIGIRRLYPR